MPVQYTPKFLAYPEVPNRELLMAVLNATVDSIVVICDQSAVRFYNQSAETLFEYPAREILGQSVNKLMPECFKSRHDKLVSESVRKGSNSVVGTGRRVQARTKSGSVIPIHLSLNKLTFGTLRLFVGVARDLRDRPDVNRPLDEIRERAYLLQKKISEYQKTNALSVLASGMAHEINQPLAAITTYANAGRNMVEDSAPHSQHISETLDKISSQALRVGRIVHRLRERTSTDLVEPERVGIDQIVCEVEDLANLEAAESGCALRIVIPPDLPAVWVSRLAVQYVVLLLLRNSFESIESSSIEFPCVTLSARYEDGEIVCFVEDNGRGVDDQLLDWLYHPFTTSDPERLGIGLNMCNSIVNRLGGRLWHESRPTGNCRFSFSIPVYQEIQS